MINTIRDMRTSQINLVPSCTNDDLTMLILYKNISISTAFDLYYRKNYKYNYWNIINYLIFYLNTQIYYFLILNWVTCVTLGKYYFDNNLLINFLNLLVQLLVKILSGQFFVSPTNSIDKLLEQIVKMNHVQKTKVDAKSQNTNHSKENVIKHSFSCQTFMTRRNNFTFSLEICTYNFNY